MSEIESLKTELAFYKEKFSVGESDLALKGYLAFVQFVKQQVEFIADFKIKENIEGKKTETAMYDRAVSMGEGLPKIISSMNTLKLELNIQFDESEGKPKIKATTPQSLMKRD